MIRLLTFLTLSLTAANAAVNVTIHEVGSDVVVSHSGTINLAATDLRGADGGVTKGILGPSNNHIVFGASNEDAYNVTFSQFPFAMIIGIKTAFPDTHTGDLFGISNEVSILYLPDAYVSGSTITGGARYNNTTIDGLGLTEGTFTATFSNGGNTENVFFTVAVPEMSKFSLFLGLLACGFALFSRRRGDWKVILSYPLTV